MSGFPRHSNQSREERQQRSPLSERLVALLGAAAVVFVAGFMFYRAIWGEDTAPRIEVELVRIQPTAGEYLVEILVNNSGGNTAAGAAITGELMPEPQPDHSRTGGSSGSSDGQKQPQPIETASVTIDYVPPHTEIQAGLYFEHPPTPERLEFSVGGYHRP